MSGQVHAQASPALWAVGPFFFAAPIALVGAGVILLGMSGSDLRTYNHPHTLAFVHTLVLGWVTLIMFGATYQLGSAVLRAPMPNTRLLNMQLIVHVLGVAALVLAFRAWDFDRLHFAPALVLCSVFAHLWTTQRSFRPSADWVPARMYLAVSTAFLFATVLVGAAWAQTLDGGWLVVTPSRIAAHAHLGLVGWLALTLMGMFYQMIPMFMLVAPGTPRFPKWALALVATGLGMFFVATVVQGSAAIWLPGVLLMALGCTLWLYDQISALRNRRRRKPDLYFLSIVVSLVFFAAAVTMGTATAVWIAVEGLSSGSVRWLLSYFVIGVVGWMGTALVANSYKIVPFMVWFHRYSGRAGKGAVPLLADMFNLNLARFVHATHIAATLTLLLAVLLRETIILNIAALALMLTGTAHAVGLLTTLLPRRSSRPEVERD